jgi:hypothetical protein
MLTMPLAIAKDVDCAVWLLQKFGAVGWQKLAVTDCAELIVTAQMPLKLQMFQPMKRLPAVATGVSVTTVPLVKLAEQVPVQEMPAGLEVTVPPPETVTVRVKLVAESFA